MASYNYTLYGLTLEVPFPIPLLCPAPLGAPAEIVVTEGPVAESLPAPLAAEAHWQASPDAFLLKPGPGIARFLVEGGARVTVERGPAGRDDLLASCLIEDVLAVVLHQRGDLVLHANAAAASDGAIVVAGISGAGKTTTLSALLARGCAMLADDVTVLRLGDDGIAVVLPGLPILSLCGDAAAVLGQEISGFPRHPRRRMKAMVPTGASMAADPVPLRALYLLDTCAGTELRQQRLSGGEKFAAVQECLYAPLLAAEQTAFLPLLAAITRRAAVTRLSRPLGRWSMDEVVEAIMVEGSTG